MKPRRDWSVGWSYKVRSEVWSVAFAPDGSRMLSGDIDGTVRLWNLSTGHLLASLLASRDGEWLAMTPAGSFAASRQGGDMVSIMRGTEVYPLMRSYDRLHRPGLVEEALEGDPEGQSKDAANKIDLQ